MCTKAVIRRTPRVWSVYGNRLRRTQARELVNERLDPITPALKGNRDDNRAGCFFAGNPVAHAIIPLLRGGMLILIHEEPEYADFKVSSRRLRAREAGQLSGIPRSAVPISPRNFAVFQLDQDYN